jgi:hypothetical protein
VLWDISATGARISAARSNFLPNGFTLLFSKDGKSHRHCRVVWRKNGQLGLQFVQQADNDDRAPAKSRAKAAAPCSALELEAARSQLMVPLRRDAFAGIPEQRAFAFSKVAAGLLVLLAIASGVFYAASVQAGVSAPWAVQVCSQAKSFCDHPEFSAAASVMMMVVWLAVRGMEL